MIVILPTSGGGGGGGVMSASSLAALASFDLTHFLSSFSRPTSTPLARRRARMPLMVLLVTPRSAPIWEVVFPSFHLAMIFFGQ
jgi:hypothetical protein